MSKMGVLDLCCGMGGLSFAAKKAGLSVCAGIDTSSNALSTFRKNFPSALAIRADISDDVIVRENYELITSRLSKKKQFILVSGPPCQGFSDAGPRKIDDPRNEILISVAKAITFFKPNAALVENVSALCKAKNSQILDRFYKILCSSGYYVYCYELNALDFGVPQDRKRSIFFVLPYAINSDCILNELTRFYRVPKTVGDILGALPVPPLRPLDYDSNKDNGSLPNHYSMRHSEKVQKKIASIEQGKGPLSYRKLNPYSYAATLISGHRAPPVHYEQPRSITVREALRLQGFPDCFRVMGPFSKQMEQVTNAVPSPLGKAIISTLLKITGSI